MITKATMGIGTTYWITQHNPTWMLLKKIAAFDECGILFILILPHMEQSSHVWNRLLKNATFMIWIPRQQPMSWFSRQRFGRRSKTYLRFHRQYIDPTPAELLKTLKRHAICGLKQREPELRTLKHCRIMSDQGEQHDQLQDTIWIRKSETNGLKFCVHFDLNRRYPSCTFRIRTLPNPSGAD